jgi:5-formyltetrahydrofolate cyclo-ligase
MDIHFAEDLPEDPVEAKRLLRQNLRAARAVMAHAAGARAARRVRERALALLDALPARPRAVAAYWPVGQELDVRPLMEALVDAGHVVLLPVVAEDGGILRFRRWLPGMALRKGAHGVPVPPADSPEMLPDVVFTPMLGFDRQGHRLGQGGGHYDRTLAWLRRKRPVVAVGVAFAGQELDVVPVEPHDAPLDWIVTEAATLGPFRTGKA